MSSTPTVRLGPQPLDLEVYAGDANRLPLEILADGDPVDLRGAAIESQARTDQLSDEIGIAARVVEIDPAAGRVALEWDGEDVRALLAEKKTWVGVWDMQITADGADLPTTPLAGKFTAHADVTRP